MTTLTKNIFQRLPLLLLLLVYGYSPSQAALIEVSPGQGTISAAVKNAIDGDTLLLEDGTYIDNVLIEKFISIAGKNGREKVFINALDPTRPIIEVTGLKGSLVDKAKRATFTGLTLSGGEIKGISFMVLSSSGLSISLNKMIDNETALQVERSEGLLIGDNIITGNIKGIYLNLSNANMLERNQADSNFNNGILLLSSDYNELRENTAIDNYWNGITVGASDHNLIVKNKALKNTYSIVVTEGVGNILIDNSTMRRIYFLLPIVLIYLAIMLYLIERKAFILYYYYKYKERGRVQGTR